MPCHYIHTIYKEYIEMMLNKEKREAHEGEQVVDELSDQLT